MCNYYLVSKFGRSQHTSTASFEPACDLLREALPCEDSPVPLLHVGIMSKKATTRRTVTLRKPWVFRDNINRHQHLHITVASGHILSCQCTSPTALELRPTQSIWLLSVQYKQVNWTQAWRRLAVILPLIPHLTCSARDWSNAWDTTLNSCTTNDTLCFPELLVYATTSTNNEAPVVWTLNASKCS